MKNIVILTGAGISAESGLQTFRASDGLWCEHRIEDVATPEAYARNPKLVNEFYNMRRAQLKEVSPNAAHYALAKLCKEWEARGNVLLVTQNVDNLHDRAAKEIGANNLPLHMHGELLKVRCTKTNNVLEWYDDIKEDTKSPFAEGAKLRPNIVWFGEMPFEMERIYEALSKCDLFISIGTSGNVYPAAGFVDEANRVGAHTIELNLEPSMGHTAFRESRLGKATQIVPQYIEELLK